MLCCAGAPLAQQSTSAARESERTEIIAILEEWEGAWNRHDMRAFANLFHEDGLTGDERAPDTLVRSRKILIVTRGDDGWKVGWGQNTRFADSTPDAPLCSAPQ